MVLLGQMHFFIQWRKTFILHNRRQVVFVSVWPRPHSPESDGEVRWGKMGREAGTDGGGGGGWVEG